MKQRNFSQTAIGEKRNFRDKEEAPQAQQGTLVTLTPEYTPD
jgi:hypothetical protein